METNRRQPSHLLRALPLVVAACLLALVACSADKDAKFNVNGNELYLACSGGPGPTVIFEAAVGGDHSLWPIADRIRERAYACVYDRPGNGDSSVPDKPMTARADVADLHQLLQVANIPGPIVVVGHSYGGLIAWMEAVEHPDEVAGLVLIDSSHPDQLARWDTVMTDAQSDQLRAPFANFPYVDFIASLQEAADEFGSLPSIPLTVITGANVDQAACDDGLPCQQMHDIWLELQDEYAALRPDARHIEASTGHYVQDEAPDLVVDEILKLLDSLQPAP
jgi:pimeloyl-ACP methyl ester carboxylesterase